MQRTSCVLHTFLLGNVSWNQAKVNRIFHLLTFTQFLGKNTCNNLSTSESMSAQTHVYIYRVLLSVVIPGRKRISTKIKR